MGKLAVALLLLAAMLLGGCQVSTTAPQPTGAPTIALPAASGEVDVPFETIALEENGLGIPYDETRVDSQLLLLTSPDQIEEIKSWVTAEALADLQQVAFEQYDVVALFRGEQGGTNHQTVIERITKQNNRLVVYAQFWEPSSTMASGAAITSPYHLVKIDKQQVPSQQLELVLQARMLTPTPPPSFLSPFFS